MLQDSSDEEIIIPDKGFQKPKGKLGNPLSQFNPQAKKNPSDFAPIPAPSLPSFPSNVPKTTPNLAQNNPMPSPFANLAPPPIFPPNLAQKTPDVPQIPPSLNQKIDVKGPSNFISPPPVFIQQSVPSIGPKPVTNLTEIKGVENLLKAKDAKLTPNTFSIKTGIPVLPQKPDEKAVQNAPKAVNIPKPSEIPNLKNLSGIPFTSEKPGTPVIPKIPKLPEKFEKIEKLENLEKQNSVPPRIDIPVVSEITINTALKSSQLNKSIQMSRPVSLNPANIPPPLNVKSEKTEIKKIDLDQSLSANKQNKPAENIILTQKSDIASLTKSQVPSVPSSINSSFASKTGFSIPKTNKNIVPLKPQSNENIKFFTDLTLGFAKYLDSKKYYSNKDDLDKKINNIIKFDRGIGEKLKATIENSVKCSICGDSCSVRSLECKHLACNNCLKNRLVIEDIKIFSKFKLFFSCPVCKKKISNSLKNEIFSEFEMIEAKDKLEKKWIENQLLKNKNVQCENCRKMCGKDLFLNESCMHLCKICMAEKIRNRVFYCPVCKTEDGYNELLYEQISCSSCRNNVYFVGDMVKRISDEHELCGSCLNYSIYYKQSMCCKKILNYRDAIEINSFLFGVCKNCINEFYRERLVDDLCDNCRNS